MAFGDSTLIPTTTTVAYYKVNGDATDSSASGFNGTATNVSFVDGKFLQAGSFNGSTSKIACGNVSDETGANPFTLSCWIKFSSFSTQQMIFGKQLGSGSFGGYILWKQQLLTPTRDFISFNMVSNDSTFGQINRSSTYNGITTGVWYNLVATYDGSKTLAGTRLFINTVEAYESAENLDTMGSKSISTSADFGVGSRNSGGLPVNGLIDDAIKENRVWSPAEIKKYYANSIGKYATSISN